MASQRQMAANKRNAAKSRGPQTQEGKTRSRMNALRHGLAAATVNSAAGSVEVETSSLDVVYQRLQKIEIERTKVFKKIGVMSELTPTSGHSIPISGNSRRSNGTRNAPIQN